MPRADPLRQGAQKWLLRACVALPLLMLGANLLAWLRWGTDLPYLDDWRVYDEGSALSLNVQRLFRAVNNTISPVGLALDVTAWGDTPETKLPAVKLGEGPAVKIMDRSMIATPWVRDKLFEAAEAAGVSVQREVLAFGGTDGGAIQKSRGGVPTGTLSIPCRYVHSANEVIDMRDMEGALKVLLQFVDLSL